MLVYYIPESKPLLMLRRSIIVGCLRRAAGRARNSFRDGRRKKKRPRPERGRALRSDGDNVVSAHALALATTVLRQGFSTTSASSDARILAPAAITNTVSQLPDDC